VCNLYIRVQNIPILQFGVSMSDVDTFIVTRSIVSVVKSISHRVVFHTAANCACLS